MRYIVYVVCKEAKRQDMKFQDYCRHVHNLNTDQHHIVMYNRAWCKSYINAVRHGEYQEGYRIFLSDPGGTGKCHVVHLIQRDMSHFFKHTVKPDDESTNCPHNCPNRISSISNWWIHNPLHISIT